eukprot:TRINITY_DN4823_c0_g3_i1.p2 TRINITY_DN4823_c0_g3~~TRINITY_DN4823_c0_g3_i1.p2  ORF type:complete len:155 (-),score=43.65 TRINITY_DN4823_c0_g3_i1:52-516(-)
MLRPFQAKTINDTWYDSVAEEYFVTASAKGRREQKAKPMGRGVAGKSLSVGDVVGYSSGFRKVQQEFAEFKEEIRKFKDQPHTHKILEKRLQEVGTENLKISANNKVVQQEQGELLAHLHKLVERVKTLEAENETMINKLKRMIGRRNYDCVYI